MSRPVAFHRLAQLEVLEASSYYASVGDGLGSAFLDEVERASRLLSERPEVGPVARGDIRQKLLREFPYIVFYVIRRDAVRILAVGHHVLLGTTEVRTRLPIRRRDGQVFVLSPEKRQGSPLDVRGIDLDLRRDELLSLVHEGRRHQ